MTMLRREMNSLKKMQQITLASSFVRHFCGYWENSDEKTDLARIGETAYR